MPIGSSTRYIPSRNQRRWWDIEEEPETQRNRSKKRSKRRSKRRSKKRSSNQPNFVIFQDINIGSRIERHVPQNVTKFSKDDIVKIKRKNGKVIKLKPPGLTENLPKNNSQNIKLINKVTSRAPFDLSFFGKIKSISNKEDKVKVTINNITYKTKKNDRNVEITKNISCIVSKKKLNQMFELVELYGGKLKKKRKNLTRMARNLKKKKEKGYTVKQMKDMGFPDYFYH